MSTLSWRTAAKIATREMRAAPGKFVFVILAVAVGVGSLTGVRGFSQAFRQTLLREARQIMAADITARVFALPNARQQAVLDSLEREGIERTWITETITMMNSPAAPEPQLVSAKAIDPRVYPFYGEVKLRPAAKLADALNANTVAVSDDLLLRLKTNVGGLVRLGGQDFRIAGVVESEPDRMSGSLNLGLRVLMTRDGLERTGLLRPGSRAAQRYLFKLPRNVDVGRIHVELKQTFPEARVVDYRETNPTIAHGLERSTTFLSLVSLIALIVGALGVATAMHAHLQQRLDTIAIMKSIGARSGQVLRIYVLQTLWLGLLGGLTGIFCGAVVQKAFPYLIRRYFSIQPEVSWDWASLAQGILIGVLATLLFTIPPLLGVRRIRPSVILRRDMPDAKATWRQRFVQSWTSLVAGAAILAGIGGIAAWLSESAKMGWYFVAGLVVSLLALAAVAWALLRGLRWFLRTTSLSLPPVLRHGMANLYRPGNQAGAVLVALGVGVMFTLTTYLLQHSILVELVNSAPPGMANVFLIDMRPEQKDGVAAIVQREIGRQGKLELIPSVSARITRVNGTPVEELPLMGWARRFRSTRSVTWSATQPEHTQILEGEWWGKDERTPEVSVAEDAAHVLGLHPGSTLELVAGGRTIEAHVAAVHRPEAIRLNALNEFVFTPPTLQGLPAIYYGGAHVAPSRVPGLQRKIYEQYPTVTVVNVADALAIVQEVVDQIALVIRFLSLFAILAGVIILASSVAGTRFRRIREVVILKTLGGTRRRIAAIFSVEFLILGVVAGAMGTLLASLFAKVLLRRVLQGEFLFEWRAALLAVALTALVANGAGWLASFRILGQRPLEVLREE